MLGVNENLNRISASVPERAPDSEKNCAQEGSKSSELLDKLRWGLAQQMSRMSKKTKLSFIKELLNQASEAGAKQPCT